jgi:hypothetical protein
MPKQRTNGSQWMKLIMCASSKISYTKTGLTAVLNQLNADKNQAKHEREVQAQNSLVCSVKWNAFSSPHDVLTRQ